MSETNTETQTQTEAPIPTDPEFRAAPWRPVPSLWEQALEAARDDPDLQALTNLLYSLPGVYVYVDGEDERWRETTIFVSVDGPARSNTDDVLRICRRAGWELRDVTWERERLEFVRRNRGVASCD